MYSYASFSVLYCTECKKAYHTNNSYGAEKYWYRKKLVYYEDFPSISCKQEVCPLCIETLSVLDKG